MKPLTVWKCLPPFCILLMHVCIPTTAKTQEHSLWKDLGLYGGQIKTIAVAPGGGSTLYAGSWGGDGLFKSTDAGRTWFSIPQNNPSWFRNYEVYDIAVDPNNPDTVWVADSYFLDLSRDGGITWQTFFFAKDERRFCYTVAVDPHDPTGDTVFVGTGGPEYADEYGEIFVTRDGGITWSKMNISGDIVWHNFWKITFNPNQQGEIWIANRKSHLSPDGLIIVSPDDGKTWWYWSAAYWPAQDSYYVFGYLDEIAVNPSDPMKIFASSQYGIARKLDGVNLETRWFWTSLDDACRALCIPPAAPDTLYAGLLETIAKSTDDGATWDISRSAPAEFLTLQPDPNDAERLFGGSVNRGIFTTNDGAATWAEINTGIRANTIYDTSVAACTFGTRVVSGTLAGIYFSKDLTSWQRIYNASADAVAFHPATPDTIYAGTGYGTGWEILKSTNSGQNWRYIEADVEEDSKITSLSILPSSGAADTVLAGVSYGSGIKGEVIKITDWSYDTYDTMSVLLNDSVPVNTVAVHPHNPSCMFAGTGSFYAPVAQGTLYRSTDGGRTWRKPLPLKKLVVNSIAIAFSNPNVIYIGCGGSNTAYAGIYKSTDAGATWELKTGGLPKHFAVRDIMVDPDDSSIAYAALYRGYDDDGHDLGGIYVTLDGGSYWTRVGLSDYRMYDINVLGVRSETRTAVSAAAGTSVVPPSSTLFAGTASGMYQTTTAGTGILTGSVVSDTGAVVDGALISTSAGCGGQSVNGYFLLMLPSGIHTLYVTAPGYASLALPSIAVGAGQSVEYTIVVTPASSDNATTCLATRLLEGIDGFSTGLSLLRGFRDTVLDRTPSGRFFIHQYYELGPELWRLFQSQPALRDRATGLMALAWTRASQNHSVIPAGSLDALSNFLLSCESVATDPLRSRINDMRCRMRRLPDDRLPPGDPHR